MSFLIDVLNGVQKLVAATPAAVGAEPALSDPGPGTWYLRSIGAVRSWVASIPWAGVDKTGAVASDVGALDVAPIQAAGHLSGFADKANITQSYNEANRTVTTSHPSGTIVMYWKGARITRPSPWVTAAHSATVNTNYFYYSNDGVNFNWSTTAWEFEDIQVAMIRLGTSLKIPIRECHGLMDPDAHREFHKKIWTYVDSGGALTAGTYAIGVADDASITPGVDACLIRDEDLPTSLNALSQGTYTVCIPLSGEFSASSLAFPFQYAPGSYIRYFPADTGTPTTGTTGKYYNVYRVAVPTMDPSSPVRWLWIAPQAEYDSLALASAESFDALRLGDLTLGTSEHVPFERIVFRAGSPYTSTGKVRIEAVQRLERVPITTSVAGIGLTGSGTAGKIPAWVSPSTLGDSLLQIYPTYLYYPLDILCNQTIEGYSLKGGDLAGTGTRALAADSTGKLVALPTIALDVGAATTGTSEQTLYTGVYTPSKAEITIRGYTGGAAGTYTVRVKDNGNVVAQESFTVTASSIHFVIRLSVSLAASDCLYDMISGTSGGAASSKIVYAGIGFSPTGALTITGQSSTALDGLVLRHVVTTQGG